VRKVIWILWALIANPIWAQDIPTSEDVVVRFGGLGPKLELNAGDPETNARDLEYQPAIQSKTFLGINYKTYGVALSTFNPRTSDFRKKHGNGRATDFQFRYLHQSYFFETFYQQYRGYYLSNAKRVMTNPLGPDGECPSNSSLRTERYGIVISRFSDIEKFNPLRALDLTLRPTQGGGTWYTTASLNAHRIRTPQTLVPATATESYPGLQDLRDTRATTLGVGGGYAYSFVFREAWVASAMAGLSLGSQWIESRYVNDKAHNHVGALRSQLKAALGYSGEKFLSAFTLQMDGTQIKNRGSELNLTASEFAIFFGFRF